MTTPEPQQLTTPPPLPKGLREVGPGRYLIQLVREGQRLTRRVNGRRADALKALDQAKVDLGMRLAGLVRSGAAPLTQPVLAPGPEAAQPPVVTSPPTTPTPASVAPSPPAPSSSFPTLADFVGTGGRYTNHQLRNQSERTRRKLTAPMRHLVASDLGPMRLDAIKAKHINDYVAWRLRGEGPTFAKKKDGTPYRARSPQPSATTINKSLEVLKSVLHFAHSEEVISAVPRIEMLKVTDSRHVHGPSREQLQALLRAAEGMRLPTAPREPAVPHLVEVLQLLGEFGFRPGELFNLTWASVDFNHAGDGERRGAVYVEEQKRRGFTPKHGKRRLIPMSPTGRQVLLKLKAQQTGAGPDDLVVPNTLGMPYIRLDTATQKGGGTWVWKRLARLSGVPISMYAMRHYFAEQTLGAGVPIHVVSRWMGHSKLELTVKRYGHFSPENADQWAWAARRESVRAVEPVKADLAG